MLDEALKKELERMESFNKENHQYALAIPHDEGLFLHQQVLLRRPERIIELGTSTGYSTVWLASAASQYGGRVETVEFDPEKITLAQDNFKRCGLSESIDIFQEDANEYVASLKGEVQFIFMDTEKEDYLSQFKALWPLLSPGSACYADNAVDLAENMEDFLHYVSRLEDGLSVTCPVGNGLEITLRTNP